MTDLELARECVAGWGLDRSPNGDWPSHMDEHEYDMDDIVTAFAHYREHFAARGAEEGA
jgi:hypothetical protein